jgi:beta-phosphoglucomutase-like phosphatase (HAD superfamily)
VRSLHAAGYKQAVASSTPLGNIHLILSALIILDVFDAIISGDEVSRGKPDPEAFLKAAKGMSLVPHTCLVVEDSAPGIEAARRAGMRSMAVTNTVPGEKLAPADRVVQTLEEVNVDMVARLLT